MAGVVGGLPAWFIPAYAGNTVSPDPLMTLRAVHPRVCGEHSWFSVLAVITTGSSPRMRGTLRTICFSMDFHRFIPAYAGNTGSSLASASMASVHPRVCGEHYLKGLFERVIFGSSPRMRGTLQGAAKMVLHHRFIPAYAGNTTKR